MTAATPVPEHDTFGTPDGRTYSAPEAAATPGRAAYEVGDRVRVTGTVVATNRRADWVSIDAGGSVFSFGRASSSPDIAHAAAREPDGQLLSDHLRERGRPGVAAMIEDAERAAREPHAADVVACEWCAHPKLKHEVGNGRCFGRHDDATACKCTSFAPAREQPEPQPAPGIPLRSDAETCDMLRADLADAEARRDRERIARLHMAGERDEARTQLTNTLGWFTSNGSGHTARVSATILARAYRNGRLAVPEELRRYL